MAEPLLYRWLLFFVGTLFIVQTVRLWWSRAAPRLAFDLRKRRAAEGEREAESLLRSVGYAIEARQPRTRIVYGLDHEEIAVDVRADLLVRRGSKRYVAEVKTGARATQIRDRATRRQILEYAHAFEVDGVLLVDADCGRVSVVHVPERAIRTRASRRTVWTLSLAAVLVVSAVLAALVVAP